MNASSGDSPAIVVARDMLESFPNIRLCLMVGIGDGAPSENHDIRLGDIVAGSSVFKSDSDSVQRDSLNQPPALLCEALYMIQSTYGLEGHQLDDHIKKALEEWPRLRKTHSRPPSSSDRLYKPQIFHAGTPNEPCREVCGDDPSNLELRREREEEEDNPAIHYGSIASSTRPIKDALTRDRLAAKDDVLCFETEVISLIDGFPCLVLRGICDYADSHKSKEWQGYAAMAAAAFAKDLL